MKNIVHRMILYLIIIIIALCLIPSGFICEFAKNLGYGILASSIVAALIDLFNYRSQKKMLAKNIDRIKNRIAELCKELVSDIQKYCKQLELQIDEECSLSQMNELFFVKIFSEEIVFNETFHAFLTKRIISRYFVIRDQLYDLISFIYTQDDSMGNSENEHKVLIESLRELIASIDKIEEEYIFHISFEKAAGFLDLQNVNSSIDEFIEKAKVMFPTFNSETDKDS